MTTKEPTPLDPEERKRWQATVKRHIDFGCNRRDWTDLAMARALATIDYVERLAADKRHELEMEANR